MSAEYEGKDPLELAEQAEHDINSYQAKTGNARAGASDSSKSAWLVRRIVHSIGWVAFTLWPTAFTDCRLTAIESGIDASVTRKFPGSTAEYGSHVSGAGDNRDIPIEEGGDIQKGTGRPTKAGDFDQGEAGEGPEDILRKREAENPGSDEFGRNRRELHDQVRGTPGGGDGAGATVSGRGPGYTEDTYHAAGNRIPK
jgi:hypothetical protein